MRLSIQHKTRFTYGEAAQYALLQLRVRPMDSPSQTVRNWTLSLDGAVHQAEFFDQYGTATDLITFDRGVQAVDIHVVGEVETFETAGVMQSREGPLPLWYYLKTTHLTQPSDAILSLSEPLEQNDRLACLHGLSDAIRDSVTYETGTTLTTTPASEAMAMGRGVCQDHSHIFLSAARALGIPARYVSGYLMMDDRADQDASHAWVEAFVPDLGWLGLDISNGISPDERYVKIAHGLDYADCAPTRGVLIGSMREQLAVSIQVQQ